MIRTPLLGERYRLVTRIARGGMADVYEGYDAALERPVAVKVLRTSSGEDPGALVDEITTLGRLNHPGIVGLYDAGEHDGEVFLVLELVQGRSLREAIADAPLSGREVRRIGAVVAAGLAHAHAAGIVHRDVKPSNILLGEEGARLADFGIARATDASRATVTDALLGTAGYLAPEQVTGEAVGAPADVYALGLVLLEAVTGRREYPGPPVEAAFARLRRDPAIPADLDPVLADALHGMLARDAGARPSAAEVAAALASDAELAPRSSTGTASTAGARPPSRRQLRRADGRRRPRRPRPRTWQVRTTATLTAVLLTGGLVTVGASLSGSEEPEEAPADIAPASGPVAPLHPDVDEALRELEAAVAG